MQKIFIFFAGSLVISCSKNESSSIPDYGNVTFNENSEPKPVLDSAAISLKNITEGKLLIEGTDCMSCHKIDAKLIGPSYLDIAGIYDHNPANVDLLAGKIIDGGSGVWGNIPMAAHSGMSKENAKKMVDYILSLKKYR
jgi:cytochrome c